MQNRAFFIFFIFLPLFAQGENTFSEAILANHDGPLNYSDERLWQCHYCFENTEASESSQSLVMQDGQSVEMTIISRERLDDIFEQARSGTGVGRGLDYSEIETGCLQRAHILNHRLATMGIESGKVYATGNSGINYNIDGQAGYYTWAFHVAPTVLVRYGDRVQMMVIDPALAQRPLTVSQWLQIQNGYPPRQFDDLFFTSRNHFALSENLGLRDGGPTSYINGLRQSVSDLGL